MEYLFVGKYEDKSKSVNEDIIRYKIKFIKNQIIIREMTEKIIATGFRTNLLKNIESNIKYFESESYDKLSFANFNINPYIKKILTQSENIKYSYICDWKADPNFYAKIDLYKNGKIIISLNNNQSQILDPNLVIKGYLKNIKN